MTVAQPCQVAAPLHATPPARYWVNWGYCYESGLPFATFAEALACYREHKDDPNGAVLLGEGADGDCDENGFHQCDDGLTEEEREARDAC